ncbi:MAG: TolC family protein [Gammaproteobacteria bacterium]|nr:TolC family protein [Gammaproteobacteria bacterium]
MLLLVGCTTLGPDYEEPQIAWLDSWQPDLYGQLGHPTQQANSDLRFWWHLFDDQRLNQLIATAKKNNPSLHIAGLRILESRAALNIAGSSRRPQLQQINGALSAINTDQSGGGSNNTSDDFFAYQSEFRVGWELDFWGRFQRGIESADAVFLASVTAQQDLQVLLSAQVTQLYFAYSTLAKRIDVAQTNAARQKRSYALTQKLFEAGQGSELDLQQAKTQYLSTQASVPQLQAGLTQIRNALCALLGLPPGELALLTARSSSLPAYETVHLPDIPAQLLLRRPDIRTAAWRVAAQSAQIGVAKADYYPAISLSGQLGWSGNSLNSTANTSQLSAGPSFTWNIFDYGRVDNNVRLQDARLQQSIEAFRNRVLIAAKEIDDAAISLAKYGEQQEILKQAIVSAERSLDLANIRYREGYANFQRVLDAQRSLLTQTDRYLVTQGAHLNAVAALYKAFGGGWSDMPPDTWLPANIRTQMQKRTDWSDWLEQAPSTSPRSGAKTNTIPVSPP